MTSKLYKLYNNKNIPDTSRLTNNWQNDVSSLLFIELPNVKDGSQVKTYSYTVHINSNVPVNIWFINILINITIILIIALNLLAFENTKLFIISTHYILFILYFRCGGVWSGSTTFIRNLLDTPFSVTYWTFQGYPIINNATSIFPHVCCSFPQGLALTYIYYYTSGSGMNTCSENWERKIVFSTEINLVK